LPSKPKIFHGRETEVESIMKILSQQSPRIAILGGGGMGKTSLARAVLHNPETSAKFEERYFVSAEAATTSIELAALIGLHVGLNPGKDLTKLVIQFFSRKPSCLLILDNLEAVWEPFQSRGEVEEFFSLLTEIQHLGLIITMRGAERPAKVQWTHPFLLPLQPLSDAAAHQTFLEITDNAYAIEDLNQLLSFTDNMPLAVDLISHLVDYEGLENVLSRWQIDKTSILSVGYDRRSDLDASIGLSLSSPQLSSESKELLSPLSILPNGLSDAELVQSKLPIPNILSCKAALLATCLACQNNIKRLLVLVPIREHIQQLLPPTPLLIYSLCQHFHALLKLYKKYRNEQRHHVVSQITANLGNLQSVLQQGL
ncbi:P-loop containing nucleoside triphosphate hydrolase protein, partial [Mycena sanguinolenta]